MIGRRWEGRSIVLMPFLPEDIALTYDWFADPAFWQGVELKSPSAYESTMDRRSDDSDWTIWSVMTRDTAGAWETGNGPRTLIGFASLHDFNFGRIVRSSYAYLRPDARGNGYGRELIELRSDYAFEFLGMEMVETTTMTENIVAQRALESVGYRCTGTILRSDYFDGRWHDSMIYVLFPDTFRRTVTNKERTNAIEDIREPLLTRS